MYLKQAFKPFLCLTLFSTLLACSSEPIPIKIGETFQVDASTLTIETIEQRKILVNDKEQLVKIAPEGQHYLYFKLHNPDEEMVFIRALEGEEKLEREDLGFHFNMEVDEAYENGIYLVNDGDKIQFNLRTPDDVIYTVTDSEFPNKDDRQVSSQMKAFMTQYANGVNLLTPLKGFIAVENVYDVATERGADVPTSPMVKGMEIRYLSKDGTTYQTSSNFLGSSLYSTVTWEGDHIVDFKFELP